MTSLDVSIEAAVLPAALANAALLIAAPSLGCLTMYTSTFSDLCRAYSLPVPDLTHVLQYHRQTKMPSSTTSVNLNEGQETKMVLHDPIVEIKREHVEPELQNLKEEPVNECTDVYMAFPTNNTVADDEMAEIKENLESHMQKSPNWALGNHKKRRKFLTDMMIIINNGNRLQGYGKNPSPLWWPENVPWTAKGVKDIKKRTQQLIIQAAYGHYNIDIDLGALADAEAVPGTDNVLPGDVDNVSSEESCLGRFPHKLSSEYNPELITDTNLTAATETDSMDVTDVGIPRTNDVSVLDRSDVDFRANEGQDPEHKRTCKHQKSNSSMGSLTFTFDMNSPDFSVDAETQQVVDPHFVSTAALPNASSDSQN